ncbi:exodeoxyribonuclease V subunit gamma [Pasteurellaceae bacterium Macca]|nr:exodeoxyribonuclease V subunit gamma [Pasteurellaceae bacterium Macca]
MFTVHFSNQIAHLKENLIGILQQDPNPNAFAKETVLVQSLGMAQWLQMQIAEELGVAGNVEFPYPTSFLWQQYRTLFPELPKENLFERSHMTWRLMRLIPTLLHHPEFQPLANYLNPPHQLKLYQLASKIADLFDQYLVYRPQWLVHWEKGETEKMLKGMSNAKAKQQQDEIRSTIQWQSQLWNALVADIRQDSDEAIFIASHRAYLQQRYFDKLDNLNPSEKEKLPQRIFIFGISALPLSQFHVFQKLSAFCDIHLFFTNPSSTYWGNDLEDRMIERLAMEEDISLDDLANLYEAQGNPLLALWGKQGKEFFNLLLEAELENHAQENYDEFDNQENASLLTQVKQAILSNQNQAETELYWDNHDHSIQIHACHSPMREVEVLHNQLLHLFEQNPSLSPKDIIVMSADIDRYAPYIHAVFSRYERQDPRHIPFALSDQKIATINPIIASFLRLLDLNERSLNAENLLDFFDIQALRERFKFSKDQLFTLREWVKSAGIRSGLYTENPHWQNHNSWENGLNRLLLGTSMKAEHQAWEGIIAFDESYGLSAELAGQLAKFLENLTPWLAFIRTPQPIAAWHAQLTQLLQDFYAETEESMDSLATLRLGIETIVEQVQQANFTQAIDADVMRQLFEQQLAEQRSHLNFLVGRVNFCTLLPMRAIPFKVVCLLGMNEGEFPRQQSVNSFDLMQYAPQRGDRAKRDDDRYLFLEALLSAQQIFYISYIGQSLTSSQEKLPSVLVTQLLDYLEKNSDDLQQAQAQQGENPLVQKQAMTVFSPSNFQQHRSYDKEWLAAKNEKGHFTPFLSPIDTEESPFEIALDDLIAYLTAPMEFFCKKQLGLSFQQEDEAIEEAEHFALTGLEHYLLLDNLLHIEKEQQATFFHNEQLKGNLPVNAFATLEQETLENEICLLREKIKTYLHKESQVLEITYPLTLKGEKITLFGNIPHYFEDEIVLWRVGNLREKDLIRAWVYHLCLIVTDNLQIPLCFYYRTKDDAKQLTFSGITIAQAQELLECYVQDYLTSQKELQWALNTPMDYFDRLRKAEKSGKTNEECIKEILDEQKDPYLKRVLAQTSPLDFNALHEKTTQWFETMMQSKKEKQ